MVILTKQAWGIHYHRHPGVYHYHVAGRKMWWISGLDYPHPIDPRVHSFDDIDFAEGDYCGFDEDAGVPTEISELEWKFEVLPESGKKGKKKK